MHSSLNVKIITYCQLPAVCGEKAPAHSTGATGYGNSQWQEKLQRQLFISGTTTPLMNGSVKPRRSSQ